ncbi:pca operon transcription factor PcaQ, partial [Pseudomonas syringae pv. tagetis]
WMAPLDAVSLELQGGTRVELDMGIREPGGSVGLCSYPALPLTRAAQWCVDELRVVGEAFRNEQYP